MISLDDIPDSLSHQRDLGFNPAARLNQEGDMTIGVSQGATIF